MKLVHELGPNDCRGPSYQGDDIREVFAKARERCGEPTTVGELCAACAERLRKARADPNTFGSVLANALRNVRDSKN